MRETKDVELEYELRATLNRFSAENGSDTPDFILAQYLLACLAAFNEASRAREKWYGKSLSIGGGDTVDADVVASAVPAINAHMNALRDGIDQLQQERDDREALWTKYRDSGALTHEPRKP